MTFLDTDGISYYLEDVDKKIKEIAKYF